MTFASTLLSSVIATAVSSQEVSMDKILNCVVNRSLTTRWEMWMKEHGNEGYIKRGIYELFLLGKEYNYSIDKSMVLENKIKEGFFGLNLNIKDVYFITKNLPPLVPHSDGMNDFQVLVSELYLVPKKKE